MQPAIFARSIVAITLCSLFASAPIGCGGSNGPPRVAVRGEIIFENEPLAAGRITFTPIEDTKGPIAVATVKNGTYLFDRRNGPIVGKNRVQIESLPQLDFELDDEAAYGKANQQKEGKSVLPPERIPSEFNKASTLVANISTTSAREIDFQLDKPSTPSRR